MSTDPDVVLAEVHLDHVTVRAVRTRAKSAIREALAAGGTAVGKEIIEVRWGDQEAGQPVVSERPSMIIVDDARAVVFGLLPDDAMSAEAVSTDGERVSCTTGPGVWIVILPNNEMGAELYPVLFRDREGAPVNPGLPAEWAREPVGAREVPCPACGSNGWDLVTAAWQGTGPLRNTRWGHNPLGAGKAFVCRVCGFRRALRLPDHLSKDSGPPGELTDPKRSARPSSPLESRAIGFCMSLDPHRRGSVATAVAGAPLD